MLLGPPLVPGGLSGGWRASPSPTPTPAMGAWVLVLPCRGCQRGAHWPEACRPEGQALCPPAEARVAGSVWALSRVQGRVRCWPVFPLPEPQGSGQHCLGWQAGLSGRGPRTGSVRRCQLRWPLDSDPSSRHFCVCELFVLHRDPRCVWSLFPRYRWEGRGWLPMWPTCLALGLSPGKRAGAGAGAPEPQAAPGEDVPQELPPKASSLPGLEVSTWETSGPGPKPSLAPDPV